MVRTTQSDETMASLKNEVIQLQNEVKRNKVFTNMVVHGVKHPTEAMIALLEKLLS